MSGTCKDRCRFVGEPSRWQCIINPGVHLGRMQATSTLLSATPVQRLVVGKSVTHAMNQAPLRGWTRKEVGSAGWVSGVSIMIPGFQGDWHVTRLVACTLPFGTFSSDWASGDMCNLIHNGALPSSMPISDTHIRKKPRPYPGLSIWKKSDGG